MTTNTNVPYHVALWLDHESAHLFFEAVLRGEGHPEKVKTHHHNHKHPTDTEKNHYFQDLLKRIEVCEEILITGPGHAKTEFKHYLETHAPKVAEKVVGLETLDHPTENQIRAFANKVFKAIDKRLGTCPI
jgi:stalled ribosome rescue protein Dom34